MNPYKEWQEHIGGQELSSGVVYCSCQPAADHIKIMYMATALTM